jgi:hypothetical protein
VTARERVEAIRQVLADGDALPAQVRNDLMVLTGLFGSLTVEYRVSELAYKHVLNGCYQAEASANRARIAAEATPHYRAMSEAKDAMNLCIEAIRSCKTFLRSLDEEMRLSR